MGFRPPNYTPTPNELFDFWLPQLKEVELKVFLVISRYTFGWHKNKVKASLTQLEKATGCSLSNIKEAVKSLIDKKLIAKEVVGPIGQQQTIYEVFVEDSNNSYPAEIRPGGGPNLDWGGGLNKAGSLTSHTYSKESIKENNNKESEKTRASHGKPLCKSVVGVSEKKKVYECLEKAEMPQYVKEDITRKFDEERVKNALGWALSLPNLRSLAASVRHACTNSLKAAPKQEDVEEVNRSFAKKYDNANNKNSTYIQACHKTLEIIFGASQKLPIVLNYSDITFKEKLLNYLKMYNFNVLGEQC